MTRRLDKTLVDYVVIAINPVMIMALVGSLAFFLAEVFYQGQYSGRLDYVLALFIMAAVLIGRISIEHGKEHAQMYGLALAIVTYLALNKFVQFHGGLLGSLNWVANPFLIGLIWWSAHKLTWDCTLIDESEDSSGEGLLGTAGLDRDAVRKGRSATEEEKAENQDDPDEPEGVTASKAKTTWWGQFVERQRRPHAPGVWVVYFSLAALPLFGFGQAFIPPAEADSRQRAFNLLLIYVTSGLGLLLTTSFLGLRRYLRQRRIEMPVAMTGVWLTIGCGLILAILVLAAMLPRPGGAQYARSELPFSIGSRPRESSKHDMMGGEAAEEDKGGPRSGNRDDENGSPAETKDDDENSRPGSEDQSGGSSSQPESEGGGSGAESEDQGGSESESESQGGGSESESESQGGGSESGEDSGGNEEQSKPEDAGENPRSNSENEDDQGDSQSRSEESDRRSRSSGQGRRNDSSQEQDQTEESESQSEEDDNSSGQSQQQQPLNPQAIIQGLTGWIGPALKWLIYGILIAVIVFWLWRSRAELLASLRGMLDALREFWQRLFGGKSDTPQEAGPAEEALQKPVHRRFSDFADPFATGTAARYSPDELVRYSYEAFEAWARENGFQRAPDQTPHEFALHVGAHVASVAQHARRLADLYCRVAYAPDTLPATSVKQLKPLWREMEDQKSLPVQ